jgi:hypothetical protein
MPQLGPAFLHRPLALPEFSSMGDGARWLADGALSLLPEQITSRGWNAHSVLCAFRRDGSITELGAVETSWSGARRLAPIAGGAGSLPVCVVLEPDLVFITQSDLPLAARDAINKTIGLRMDDLSPIPPDEAAFAIGEVRRNGGRLLVDVAIAQKQTLADVAQAFAEKRVLSVGAAPAPSGAITYVFTGPSTESLRQIRKRLLAFLALWGSALLAIGALEARQEKTLAGFDAYQHELRGALRNLKTESDTLKRLQQFAPRSYSFAEVAESMASGLNTLSDGAVVTEVSIVGDGMTISGLAREDESGSPAAPDRKASDYPGFDLFSLSAPMTHAPLDEASHD